jgi:hypothetical protein
MAVAEVRPSAMAKPNRHRRLPPGPAPAKTVDSDSSSPSVSRATDGGGGKANRDRLPVPLKQSQEVAVSVAGATSKHVEVGSGARSPRSGEGQRGQDVVIGDVDPRTGRGCVVRSSASQAPSRSTL